MLKKYINEVKREMMKEDVPSKMLDGNEMKSILKYVNGLSALPILSYVTNMSEVKKIEHDISALRIKLMNYVEANSGYKFTSSGANSWKLVKK